MTIESSMIPDLRENMGSEIEKNKPIEINANVKSGKLLASKGSRIFTGYRALGYVSNHIPLQCRFVHRRRENLIVTSVGRAFHTYGGNKLGLLSVSKLHPDNISVLASDSFMVYSSAGNTIYAWRRGSELKHVYNGHKYTVHLLLPFGPNLISVDQNSNLKVWDIKSEELIREINLNHEKFSVTTICHPYTYKDKILLGSEQGSLQLWNIKSSTRIYKFNGWGKGNSITCLEPCPSVLDAVAIGLQDGEIIVHNMKYDETFVKFKQDWGPVSSLSFRSDRTDILISGSTVGHIAIWNLNDKKLAVQMRQAHRGDVTGLYCFPDEPILMTSSPDNSVKQWIFDMPDGGGRLLRLREGHSAPPTKIRFYGSLGDTILSASEDSTLRSFSTITDALHKSFGVASYNRKLQKKKGNKRMSIGMENEQNSDNLDGGLKMEPIIDFTTDTIREKDWDNIACIHRNTGIATTWSFGSQKMGSTKSRSLDNRKGSGGGYLRHSRFKEMASLRRTIATAICMTSCGNFVLIGYSSGHIDKYNIQSGIHRGELVDKKGSTGKSETTHGAHPNTEIRGIVTDSLNQIVVTGDAMGTLKFWKFSTNILFSQMQLTPPGAGIRKMELHRDNSLLAVVTSQFGLMVIDTVSRLLVRRFQEGIGKEKFCIHNDQITDLVISPNSQWIITASLDSTIKVWDIPSGTLVDHILFPSPVTSLTFSATEDFLATCHVGDLGVYLWTNMTLYSHVTLRPLEADSFPQNVIQMPSIKANQGEIASPSDEISEDDAMDLDDDIVLEDNEKWISKQIGRLATLANLPTSRWQNLLNLDVIKARNKPKNAVTKPEAAPFFLPSLSNSLPSQYASNTKGTVEIKFQLGDKDLSNDDQSSRSKLQTALNFQLEDLSEFGKKLSTCDLNNEHELESTLQRLMNMLKEKGPSAIEIELQKLSPEGGGSIKLMVKFMILCKMVMESAFDFEAVQSYCALFLKLHADTILENVELSDALTKLQFTQENSWAKLKTDINGASALVTFCKSSLVSN